MKLNTSRMRALTELKAANEKIKELESKLEEAATRLNTVADPATDGTSTITYSAVELGAQPEAAVPATETPRVAAAPPPHAPAQTIVLLYETGWSTAYIHYQLDGKGGVCRRVELQFMTEQR